MLSLLFVLPALPLASFLFLALVGSRLRRRVHVAGLGVGSIGVTATLAVLMAASFLTSPPPGNSFQQPLFRWIEVGDFSSNLALYLDPLSLVMVLIVTVVGFFIHLFAAQFMLEEDLGGYVRFFAYMNLFVSAMLILVLADDLVPLYLGWEGVGLCSYLLIGFWYSDARNGAAARKAFVVTRIGDVSLSIALFVLYWGLGTLDIKELAVRADAQWTVDSTVAIAATALLLGGAVGKSAQLPLQTWLPDAMAGPTPVSALIHAATMVTAGVYLIARLNGLFLLAPTVLHVIALLGAAGLLFGGFSALTQRDIKRVLAYSTMSHIGYMFLALGVGAWAAAIFHLMTHAVFKALLFLGAGAIGMALHHEHDIAKMGGLRKDLPITFVVFVIAGASLAGFPLVTAGFYSKDSLLWAVWTSKSGGFWLWSAGLLGAFLSSLYIFRLIFLVFFGEEKTPVKEVPGLRVNIPLIVLAVASLIGGFIELPATLGNWPFFSTLLDRTMPSVVTHHAGMGGEWMLMVLAAVPSLLGLYLAYRWYLRHTHALGEVPDVPYVPDAIERFWFGGWGFDWLYDRLVVTPFVWLAEHNAADIVDRLYVGTAWLAARCHRLLRATQTGRLRWYAAGLTLGAVALVALVLAR